MYFNDGFVWLLMKLHTRIIKFDFSLLHLDKTIKCFLSNTCRLREFSNTYVVETSTTKE